MKIAVVGLGLIGGSLCKALKQKTTNIVLGIDLDEATLKKAKSCGAVDRTIQVEELGEADIVFVCLHPKATVDFILQNLSHFKKGCIVSDVCGVKQEVTLKTEEPLLQNGISYVGTHPMAGREFSGFDYSLSTLFESASFIISKTERTNEADIKKLEQLALELGFKEVVLSTPQIHDENIAFTSQLAHVVSNAYIKSPTAQKQHGFSAGSFQDLTRVAKLNEDMWTTLFLYNKTPLVFEIQTIIDHLEEYKNALLNHDENELKKLLKEGRIIKENMR